MKTSKVNIDDLKSIKNYAAQEKVTTSYIYKLRTDNKMDLVIIDGVQFVDTKKWPTLPTKK